MIKLRLLIAILLLLFLPIANADPLKLSVSLHDVKILQEIINQKSEFYLGVTEFNFPGDATHYALPGAHSRWNYKQFLALKDYQVWQKSLDHDQPVELVITVIEHRTFPPKPDRVIGLTRVFIQTKGDNINALWGLGQETTVDLQFHTENNNKVYVYTQNGSEYELEFDLYHEVLPMKKFKART